MLYFSITDHGKCFLLFQPHLRKILLDLKAEGNEMFNSTYYDLSYQFYNLALEMARNMHDNGIAPNPELISTLLSNKAACSLKMVS